jgi:hypothetical protein
MGPSSSNLIRAEWDGAHFGRGTLNDLKEFYRKALEAVWQLLEAGE